MIWLVCNRRFRIIIAFMVVIFPVNISALIIGMIQETSFFRTKTNLRCNKSSFVWVCNANNIHICVRKNKSKQSYVWIESIFKAQNICFGSEIAGLLDHSYNKCALIMHGFIMYFSLTLSGLFRILASNLVVNSIKFG